MLGWTMSDLPSTRLGTWEAEEEAGEEEEEGGGGGYPVPGGASVPCRALDESAPPTTRSDGEARTAGRRHLRARRCRKLLFGRTNEGFATIAPKPTRFGLTMVFCKKEMVRRPTDLGS